MNKGILNELNHAFGYGYITCSKSGRKLFCKYEDIDYETPQVDDIVSFDLIEGYNSELAINIRLFKMNNLQEEKLAM